MLHFYDGQIRRYLTQIIRLMSNFTYKDADGDIKQVPVLYGDLTRQVAAILKDNSENKLPSVPRMAVYITGLEMDRTRTSDSTFVSKVHIRERSIDANGNEYLNTQGRNYTVERLMPSPYTLSVNVDIWSSNTDQKLQIVEQILTLFHPTLEIQTTDNFVDWTSLSVVNLDRIEFSNRSIPVGLESEIDIATLAFSTPIYISPPAKVKRLGVITNIITSIFTESQGNIDLGISTPTNLLDSSNFEIVEERILTDSEGNAERIVDNGQFPNDGTGEMDIRVKRTLRPRQPGSSVTNSTWLALGLYIIGNKAYVIDKGEIGKLSWNSLFDVYPGCYKPGISQIRILKEDGTYIVGYVTVNPLNPAELFVEWDTDTLPSNTVLPGPARNPNSYTSIDYIIDPLRWNPTTRLVPGLRLMLLGKIGASINDDGADGWKETNTPFGDLVAGENDIIEYDGKNWFVSFNTYIISNIEYVTNLTSGVQYRWDGYVWMKSYEGWYGQGDYSIVI